MARLITILLLLLLILINKLLFRTFFTPSGTLSCMWLALVLGQQILASDMYYGYSTCAFIISLVIFFVIGEFTMILLLPRKFLSYDYIKDYKRYDSIKISLGNIIFLVGTLSIFGSMLYLIQFVRLFGSLQGLIGAGWTIREALSNSTLSIPVWINYMSMLSYLGVIFSLVYWIYFGYRKVLIMPFIAIVIYGFAQVGRAGTIILLLDIFVGSYWYQKIRGYSSLDLRLLRRLGGVIAAVVILFILVEMMRYQTFDFNSENISKIYNSFIIYAFGGLGSFTYYLNTVFSNEYLTLGRYTFSSLYQLLGIHGQEIGVYEQYLPMYASRTEVTNVYTAFRPLLEDFGFLGASLFMYFLGFIFAWVYRKASIGKPYAIALIIPLYTFLLFSIIAPLTQFNSFLASILFPPIILKILVNSKFQSRRVKLVWKKHKFG